MVHNVLGEHSDVSAALELSKAKGLSNNKYFSPANAILAFLDAIGDTRAPLFKYHMDRISAKENLDVKVRIERYNYGAPIELTAATKLRSTARLPNI